MPCSTTLHGIGLVGIFASQKIVKTNFFRSHRNVWERNHEYIINDALKQSLKINSLVPWHGLTPEVSNNHLLPLNSAPIERQLTNILIRLLNSLISIFVP